MTTDTSARQRFLEEYRQIRYAEGRGSDDPAYYRALPFRDLTGRNSAMWAMRAATFRYFEKRILAPLEARTHRPLDILDLGAGNCWMSYRLALRNHNPVAADIFEDGRDGLQCVRHYPYPFGAVAAEFDRLPFPGEAFDLIVFNSSLHYSTDYEVTLPEARRCLRQDGQLVVLDSPVYRKREHGERMAAERHEQFQKEYGFRSDAIRSIEYLDEATLARLSQSLNLSWTIHRPWYGLAWHLRPLKAFLKRRRPPSRFWILVGRFR
jgi:ubiquinone/menaquinone biosynthesis C-methylase UbiE